MNHPLRNSLISLVVLGFSLTDIAAQSAEKLEEKMTDDEFHASGLHRLSAGELNYLNQWLSPEESKVEAASFGEEQLPAQPPDPENEDAEIVTRISGGFAGWDGRTIFRLENAQIWQQRQAGKYHYRADSPEVILKRGNFGYYLKIVNTGRQIPVKRLK